MSIVERSATLQPTCSHRYCRPCITRMFECSVNSNGCFLPRTCCGKVIPVWLVSGCLGEDMTKRLKERMAEYKDPRKTYCFNASCARYLAPSPRHDRSRACSHCLQSTCTSCKGPSHQGRCDSNVSTVRDNGTKEFLKLAKKEKWRNCPGCHRMVERYEGCQHL